MTEITKKEADQLMQIEGKTKGSEFLSFAKYVETKYGQEGLKKLEKKMEELGYPIHFNEIKPAHWYLEALNVLSMIVAKELFGWKDLFEVGYNSPVFSFGVKVFIKYVPLSLFLKQLPRVWWKFIDVSSLEASEFDEKAKYMVICLKDYKFHPAMCRYFAGFFLRIAEYFIKSEKITIEETKCMFKGAPYHEFLVKWE